MVRRLITVGWVLGMAGCTLVHRANTYPKDAEITTVSWYQPTAPVPGRPSAPLEAAPDGDVPADAIAAMQAYVEPRRSQALVVLHHGKVAAEWYGPGATASSTSNSQSMAKTLVALVMGTVVAQGAIGSVEDPVGLYLPAFDKPDKRGIALRHLLEMSSGLRNDDELRLGSDLVKMYLGTHLARTALKVPPVGPPGVEFDYNNADSQLLAQVLEVATGERYEQLLSERLWRPLGASDAAVYLDREGGEAHAFCCFFATARDWARVGQLFLDDGRVGVTQVVPDDWLDRMVLPSKTSLDYGWQIWRAEDGPGSTARKERKEDFVDPRTFWLAGRGDQKVYVLPDEDAVIVRIGEEPEDWDDSVLPDLLARALRPVVAAPPVEP
jgi:CubicO group peptidase (beta-lactamase class C family)